jgi:hypothetical protein
MTNKIESNPERYLREIKEIQKQNLEILKSINKIQEKKESRRKWKFIGNILIILLPYLFSLFVAWAFYYKVETSILTIKEFIKDIPNNISMGFGDNIDSLKEDFKNKGSSILDKTSDFLSN